MTNINNVGTQTLEQTATAPTTLQPGVASVEAPNDNVSDNELLEFVVVPAYN